MLWSLCIPVPTVVSGLLTGKEVAFTLASLRSRVSSHASAKAPCPLSVTPQLSQLSAPRFQAAHQSRAVSVPGLYVIIIIALQELHEPDQDFRFHL